MKIIGLFPIPVGKVDLDRELSLEEKQFIVNQPKRPNTGNLTSENNCILEEPELTDLKSFLENSLNEFFQDTYKPSNKVSLKITQSWANYSSLGSYHHKHNHKNSIVSGVFYVDSNKDSDKIIFSKESTSIFSVQTNEFNLWNSEDWWLPSEEGVLLLFPSSLQHRVDTVLGEKERISLSFNSFFSGEIGDEKSLTQLSI